MTVPKDIQRAVEYLASYYVPNSSRKLFVQHATILFMDERRKCHQMILDTTEPGERVREAIRNMPDNVMFSEAAKALYQDF